MITRARTLSINCRNKTAMADIPFPSRHWSKRLPVLIKFINNCAPSVIGVQETRDDMAVDITNGLGPNWTFWGSGTAKIIWDSTKWIVVDQFEAGCHTPCWASLRLAHSRCSNCSRSRLRDSPGLQVLTLR